MSDYIKREDAIKAVAEYTNDCFGTFEDAILNAEDVVLDSVPSADVIEPKRGEWISKDPYWHTAICSNCNKVTMFEEWDGEVIEYKFCPNCGADMREREGE